MSSRCLRRGRWEASDRARHAELPLAQPPAFARPAGRSQGVDTTKEDPLAVGVSVPCAGSSVARTPSCRRSGSAVRQRRGAAGSCRSRRSGSLAGDRPSPVRDVTLSECLLEAPHGRFAVVLGDTWRYVVRHRGSLVQSMSGSRTRLSGRTAATTRAEGSSRCGAARCLDASRHTAVHHGSAHRPTALPTHSHGGSSRAVSVRHRLTHRNERADRGRRVRPAHLASTRDFSVARSFATASASRLKSSSVISGRWRMVKTTSHPSPSLMTRNGL